MPYYQVKQFVLFPHYLYTQIMDLSIINTHLLFHSLSIMKYDYSLNQIEVNFLADGYWFDSYNEKVIYSSGRHLADSDIYRNPFQPELRRQHRYKDVCVNRVE